MTTPSGVLALPTSLVLLLHLHILSYPKCNAPEYSPMTLFAPTRPLRDRTKIMEDIVAFLLEKIEGKLKLKSILSGTYPCLQPADSVGFRINVAKHIETLRATVTRPGLQTSTATGRLAGKAPPTSSLSSKVKPSASAHGNNTSAVSYGIPQPIAWWWSSIVVRKSLLEECSGERFEKLLLALSTHALFVKVPPSSPLHPLPPISSDIANALRNQPLEYANLLSRSMELRKGSGQLITQLNVRAQELISVRARLLLASREDHERISTERLYAIRDSKWQDLVDAWKTIIEGDVASRDGGSSLAAKDALKWVFSFAGVSNSQDDEQNPSTGTPHQNVQAPLHNFSPVVVQTLPTASAHHPANLRKLRSLPPFIPLPSESATNTLTDMQPDAKSPSSLTLQELLNNASVQNAELTTALESVTSKGKHISMKLDAALQAAAVKEMPPSENSLVHLELWEPPAIVDLDLKVSAPWDSDTMTFFDDLYMLPSRADANNPQIQEWVEAKVLDLRESLQPPIPSPGTPNADSSVESLQESPVTVKRQQPSTPLAQPAISSGVVITSSLRTPRRPRPYQTSTPPTKPSRSAQGQKQVEHIEDISADDSLLTPTGPRGVSLLSAMNSGSRRAFSPENLIADISLPEFSDESSTENGMISFREFGDFNKVLQEDGEDDDFPYEGHSVTLRDILLRVGNGGDSFDLIDDRGDFADDVGNETAGWG